MSATSVIPDIGGSRVRVNPISGVISYTDGSYYVPDFGPTGIRNLNPGLWGSVPAAKLNKTERKTEQRQLMVAGDGSLLPLIYGTDRVGGKISGVIVYNNNLHLRVEWCLGEIDAVVEVQIDDAVALSGVVQTHYRGAAGQGIDPTLATAYAADGKSYTDTLPGIAYSVLVIPPKKSKGFPRVAAKIRGMKIRTTSGGARSYQDNAAYILADFSESTTYGMGRAADWATVATLAAVNDTAAGSDSRKRITNVTLDTSQPGESWLQVMRDYAGCWAVPEGASYRLVADTTGASVMTFDSTNIVEKSFRWGKKTMLDTPTGVTCEYTDVTQTPWRTDRAPAYAPGVEAGTVRRVISRISKPGIQRYSEANRYAIERLNEYLLNDLTCSFVAFDAALTLQVGELITVTHPTGLTSKIMRAVQIDPVSPGRWAINAIEYDPAKYSSVVATGPSVVDTAWASPSNPPTVGALTMSEEVYQLDNGTYSSRIRATWAAVSWLFLAHYRVTTTVAGVVVDTTTVDAAGTTYATPPAQEGVSYQVAVQVVSTINAIGTAAYNSATAAGKTAIPGNVATLNGFEAGGKVFLNWTAAIDLDIWRYELRYGSTGGSWETATVLEQIDALTYVANSVAAGTWRFYVKALDSVRQYSTTAAYKDLTVTVDSSAFLLDNKVFDAIGVPTLTSMTSYFLRDGRTQYITDFADPTNYGYTNTNNATGLWTDDGRGSTVIADPHTAGTSKYVTQWWDMGQDLTGNIAGTITYTVTAGTVSYWLETATAAGYPGTVTQWAGGTAKTTARYVRLRLEAATTSSTFMVESGASARVDAFPREEQGTVLTLASGAKTVTLSFKYTTVKSIQITVSGVVAGFAVYDNVVLHPTNPNTFDIYAFDAAGAQDDYTVSWVFKGI